MFITADTDVHQHLPGYSACGADWMIGPGSVGSGCAYALAVAMLACSPC